MRRFTQHKGGLDQTHMFNIDDYISSCKYSLDGNYMAIGDDSGRIVIFDVNHAGELDYATQFKAHRGGHDWKTDTQIKPSVVGLQWLDRNGPYLSMVSAGATSIKFWRILEWCKKQIVTDKRLVPQVQLSNTASYSVSQVNQLPTLHSAPIRNISLSKNQEYLLSTDGKTILKWNIEKPATPQLFYTAPILPQQVMEPEHSDAIEVETDQHSYETKEQQKYELAQWNDLSYITRCSFHTPRDNCLAFSTKMGDLNYFDLRASNKLKPSIIMETPIPSNFFRRYVNSISDFSFLNDGYTLVSRDYLECKLFDLRQPGKPTVRFPVMPAMTSKLADIFQQGRYSQQFPLIVSPDSTKVLTGFYDCSFHEIDLLKGQNIRYRFNQKNECSAAPARGSRLEASFEPDPKVSCLSYHPGGNSLSVTIRDSIFSFSGYSNNH